ncbi:MAG: hypothetical protein ACREC6_14475 [Hyphomicrobiaceae bacterium]
MLIIALHPRRWARAGAVLVWLLAAILATAPGAARLATSAAASMSALPCPGHREAAGQPTGGGDAGRHRHLHECAGISCCGLLCHTPMQPAAEPGAMFSLAGGRWQADADVRLAGIDPDVPPRPPRPGSSPRHV